MPLMFKHADWLITVLLLSLFLLWPDLDLVVSNAFYDASQKTWWLDDSAVAISIYGLFARLPFWLLPLLLTCTLLTFCRWGLNGSQRRAWLFLLLALLIGPGLLVHEVFKEGFERPRPRQLEQYGGQSGYTPPWQISTTCASRCKSFVSGHAAMGFYLMVLGWVTRKRIWLMWGIVVGTIVSLVRLGQGGHFLSDTLFAGLLCYFVYRALAFWLLGYSRITAVERDERKSPER